jgi:hypothetical protein
MNLYSPFNSPGRVLALVFNLVDEHILGPAELAGHADVKFTFQRVLALAHADQIVSPGYFSNQWLEFFMPVVFQIKLPHVPEVLHRKTGDSGKFPPQIRGKAFHDGPAPTRLFLTFGNHSPDVPIKPHQFSVDRFQRLLLRLADTFLNLGEEACVCRNRIAVFQSIHFTPPDETFESV